MRARWITSTSGRGRPLIATALVVLAASLLAVAPAQAAPGDLDPTFSGDGRQITDLGFDDARAVAVQADGKLVVAGRTLLSDSRMDFALARYNPDGSLDASFSGDGWQSTDFGASSIASGVALQPDGKILVVGYTNAGGTNDFALARYNPDGSLDTSFDGDGMLMTDFGGDDWASGVALQADGRIVAVGYGGAGFALARYNPDGSLDASFSGDGMQTTHLGDSGYDWDHASAVAIQADDKIVAAGTSDALPPCDPEIDTCEDPPAEFALARYHSDGTLDASFSGDGKETTPFDGDAGASDLALQPDGKIVAVGSASAFISGHDFALARYDAAGSLDASFSGDGKQTTDFGGDWDGASGVALQPDGELVAVGITGPISGVSRDFALARYDPAGSLDASFSGDGKQTTDFGGDDQAWDGVLQPDGKIVAVGHTGGDFALARYEGASGDATAPETTITGGPAGTTNDSTPTFSFSSSEPGSTFECRVDGGAFSPCSSPHTTSPLGDGSHTFYVKARDEAGNEDPTPAQQTVVVDTVAPTGTVRINNNAKQTRTLSVTLNLQATDPAPASGVTQVRIANSQSALPSASWRPYATTMPWTLTSGRGTKTVYVQYADAASNVSAVARDSITYKP